MNPFPRVCCQLQCKFLSMYQTDKLSQHQSSMRNLNQVRCALVLMASTYCSQDVQKILQCRQLSYQFLDNFTECLVYRIVVDTCQVIK